MQLIPRIGTATERVKNPMVVPRNILYNRHKFNVNPTCKKYQIYSQKVSIELAHFFHYVNACVVHWTELYCSSTLATIS